MKVIINALVLSLCLWLYLPASYADTSITTEATVAPVTDKVVPQTLMNPQETMRTFMNAMEAVNSGDSSRLSDALSTFDLTDMSALIQQSKGKELAQTLYSVLERNAAIDIEAIPTSLAETSYVVAKYEQGQIELVKLSDGRWVFSQRTLHAIPAMLEALLSQQTELGVTNSNVNLPLYIKIRSSLPQFLKQGFLLEYWQWLGILLFIIIGSIADKALAWFLARNVATWKRTTKEYKELDNSILRPLGLMAMAIIWWFGLNMLGLPETALIILSVAVKLLVSLSAIWSAFRLVDVLDALLTQKAKRTDNKFDDLLAPMITRSLKVFVVVMGVIFSADNLNVDVTSLLAGLGLGGLAFALAAKDLLGNFLGSLTVLLDRPFHIGDWVIIGDVEGSVEEVGFRSTRIRTFYNSLITLPNALLTTSKIDNMGARRYRRMKTMLSLTYDTSPEKIDAFCEGVRALIQLHPYMRKDYYQVYFNQYNSASLDILVYVFWETPDWNTELRERHRFLLDILRLSKQLNIEFAYPTQTLYLKQNNNPVPAEMNPQNFQTAMTEKDAFELGRKEATAIVDGTLGQGVKPDPVRF